MNIGYLDGFQLLCSIRHNLIDLTSNWMIFSLNSYFNAEKLSPTDHLEIGYHGCMQVGKIEHLIMYF